MPDGFEQRQEVVFFLLQPFNLNLAIGWGGVSGFLGVRSKTQRRGMQPLRAEQCRWAERNLEGVLCFSQTFRIQVEGVATSGYCLSTLAEQLPPPVSD
jgi:hypothetical protein